MAKTADIQALVDQMPALDVRKDKKRNRTYTTGKLTGPPWPEAQKVYDQILAAGREGVAAVVGLLKATDDGADYKARYVLGGLAAYVCRKGKDAQRAAVIEALLSQLGRDRPTAIRRFVVRLLQAVGDGRAAGALAGLLADEALCEPAAQALLAIDPAKAAGAFRQALPKAPGKCRLTIVQGLGAAGDAASAGALREALADAEREVRIAAAWGLANLADAASADALIRAADAEQPWERIQAAKACLLLAEKLQAAGRKRQAARLYEHLRDTRKDPAERYLKDAAEKALAGAS